MEALRHNDDLFARQIPTTQSAEGLPRRRFTVAEIEELTEAGFFHEDDRFELIGGEIVPMCAKGNQHELLKTALNIYWARRLSPQHLFTTETTFRLTPDTFLEPDFTFYDKAVGVKGLKGDTAHLVVEIADSSYGYDIGRKAAMYAAFGVRELWVIHAVRLETRIHRKPSITGYHAAIDLPRDHILSPAFAPELAVTLSELEI
jgi:Uma2 family endonuclease